MSKPPASPPATSRRRLRGEQPIINLLPNLLTIGAICAGLTSIRLSFHGDFERAVLLILVAAILDGFDGRLARLLKCESAIGAELDSLADFVNFGIAPSMMIYVWALQDLRQAGWISVLIYAVCCVIRLARFNVGIKAEVRDDGKFFVGIPSPAGAMLVLFPMFVSFLLFDGAPTIPSSLIALYIVTVGLLMISRIPIWSFKVMTISRDRVKFLIVGFVILLAALLIYPWATLVFLDLVYVTGVLWAWTTDRRKRNHRTEI
ncbi:CDP-diacylglycerol--serine O-phosphatidyltransferase [Brevirhabdus sp.]|uniref:CDP-diacylglycerol--serine O-phosphatidyltransferase n=1 Tax=Brevirhabdus sp. TaxID=2004514 RepID=UPI004059A722